MKEIKPICFGHYTDADRGFRRCYVCKHQYYCPKKTLKNPHYDVKADKIVRVIERKLDIK